MPLNTRKTEFRLQTTIEDYTKNVKDIEWRERSNVKENS